VRMCSEVGRDGETGSVEHPSATAATTDGHSLVEPRDIMGSKSSSGETQPSRSLDKSPASRVGFAGHNRSSKSGDGQQPPTKPPARTSITGRLMNKQKRSNKVRSFSVVEKLPSANSVEARRKSLDTKHSQGDARYDDDDYVTVDFVMHAGFPELPVSVPLTFTLTMYACLSRLPEERPTFSQILTLFNDLDEELSTGRYINSVGQLEVRPCLSMCLSSRCLSA
jgi:hypothetical protein